MRQAGRVGGLLLAGAAAVLSPGTAVASEPEWSWPLAEPRTVSRAFAPPEHRYGTGHRGVDLPATPGTAVTAAGGGRVSYAGPLAGRGVVVVVHGALRTTYEPVDAVVSVGQTVSAGQLLGVLAPGHAGCAEPACLHWGLRRGEDYLDPVQLVDRTPVRLLPLGAPAPADPRGDGASPATAGTATAAVPASEGSSRATLAVVGTVVAGGLTAGLAAGRTRPRRPG